MTTKKSDSDLVAAFMRDKGATKCAAGARTHSERDMWRAVRGEAPINPRIRLSSIDHVGREIWVNEEGEFHSFG